MRTYHRSREWSCLIRSLFVTWSPMDHENECRIGISTLSTVPWGDHGCVFFDSQEELLSLVVPYVKAGLEDNEYCIWITGDPLTGKDAFEALEVVLPHAYQYLAHKQLEIIPSRHWYLPSGTFDARIVLDKCLSMARHAQAMGFAGIRITGNPVWLRSEEDWTQFRDYEEAVHQQIRTARILALCTYPTVIFQGKHIEDTLSTHNAAYVREQDQWRRLELSVR
jgi:hypothetical protein